MFGALSLVYIGGIILRTNGCFAIEDSSSYLPHLEDCSKFYREFQGIRHEFQCPRPKLFNAKLNTCDHAKDVGCHNSEVTKDVLPSDLTGDNYEMSQHAESLESGITHGLPMSNPAANDNSAEDTIQIPSNSQDSYPASVDSSEEPQNFSVSMPVPQSNFSENMNSLESGLSQSTSSFNVPKQTQISDSEEYDKTSNENQYTGYMPYSHENSASNEVYNSPPNSHSGMLSENLANLESGLSHGLSSFHIPLGRPHPWDSNMLSNGHFSSHTYYPIHSSIESGEDIGHIERPHSNYVEPRTLDSLESKLSHSLSSFHIPHGMDDSDSFEHIFPEYDSPVGNSPTDSSESDEYPEYDSSSNTDNGSQVHENVNSLEHSLSHGLHLPGLQPPQQPQPPQPPPTHPTNGVMDSSEENQNSFGFGCPSSSEEESINMIFPGNCYKFYKCSNGIPEVYDCPTPLQFNPIVGICDEPENVGCSPENVYSINHHQMSSSSIYPTHWSSHTSGNMNYPNNPPWNMPNSQSDIDSNENSGMHSHENNNNMNMNQPTEGSKQSSENMQSSNSMDEENNQSSMTEDDYDDSESSNGDDSMPDNADSFSSESKSSSEEGSDSTDNTSKSSNKSIKKLSRMKRDSFFASYDSNSLPSSSTSRGSSISNENNRNIGLNSDQVPFVNAWQHILVPVSQEWSHGLQQLSNALQHLPFVPHKQLSQTEEKKIK